MSEPAREADRPARARDPEASQDAAPGSEPGTPANATPPPPAPVVARGPIRIEVAGSPMRCPYCHGDVDAAATDWVACSSCLARHHRDCWQENVACASCKAAQYLPATAARVYRDGVGSAPAIAKPRDLSRPAPPARRFAAEPPAAARHVPAVRPRESAASSFFQVMTCLFALVGFVVMTGVGLLLFAILAR